MFTGKIIAIAVALMLILAGVAGYFVMKMRADDALEQQKLAEDARYKKQIEEDSAAGRDKAKRPAIIPQSPASWGR